ncbi:MAG: ATP-binding protein [Candidatus Wallbacteria bacterium]|nr:ATP-binding protein [Candidatus Wallbacteria bacterium]
MRKTVTEKFTAYEEFFRILSRIHKLGALDGLLSLILKSGMKLTGAEASSIMLKHQSGNFLEFHSAIGGGAKKILEKIRVPKKSIAGHVFDTGKSQLVKDVGQDPRFYRAVDKQTKFRTRSIICVPLIINRQVIGVMELLNSSSGKVFTGTDLEVFQAYASQAAVAITNSRLFQETMTAQERTDFVFDNLPVGLLLVLPDGTILATNRFFRKLSRCRRIEGRNIHHLKSEIFRQLAGFVTCGGEGEQSLRLKVQDEILDLRLMIRRLKSRNWQGTAMIIEDVTQLFKTREIAAWQDVARKLAHELKNPLTPIQLAAQYLEYIYQIGDAGFGEELKKNISIINSEVEKLKNMLTEFSSFARLPLPKLQQADLGRVIENIRQLYEKTYPAISFNIGECRVPPFMFDQTQIEQVLINLVKNSIEAIEDAGATEGKISIAVASSPGRQMVAVTLTNNGPPIPENLRNELFKPYFSTKKTGTGLGLAIVQRIVHEHGGRITVKNLSDGVRFRFEMLFRES